MRGSNAEVRIRQDEEGAKMKRMTRREFLRCMATGMGALTVGSLLGSCARQESLVSTEPLLPSRAGPSETASPPSRPTEAAVATPEPTETASPTLEELPDLVAVRGGQPRDLVRNAIAALGGIGRFVASGEDVIIKPNICVAYHTYEYAATTNPWVVAALVELCWEVGAGRVRVMDYPFGGTAEEAYVRSGIQEQVLAAGGEMEIMSGYKYVAVEIPGAQSLYRCEVYDDVLNADVVINVPIGKHHSLARLTLGMKNLMGVIADRPAIHLDLGQRLADLTSLIRPELTVVDAVRILMANGPSGGRLADVQQRDTIIASTDIVAADSYAARTLFEVDPGSLSYVRAGAARGLGRSDLENLRIEEVTLDV